MQSILNSPYRNIFIFSFIIFLITSFYSIGYFHPDEHFQILEFCNYKLGNSPASDLPWEFAEKIRPALQPALCFLLIKTVNLFGIENPFIYTAILRILTALFSWYLLSKVSLLLLDNFSSDKMKKYFLLLTFFLWFVPVISVRFSSENYSSLTFLIAVYFLIRFINQKDNTNPLSLVYAGLLLGFSFFIRFQMGFAIIGLGLWFILVQKTKWKNISILAISGIFAISISILVDYWFYDQFVITPYNYFIVNIVENKAASFGTNPWWYYFYLFNLKCVPPIGIILLILFSIGLYKNPKNLFTWIIIPFLIVHVIVAHKEIRFLFPMTFYFIYLAATGLDYLIKNYKINNVWKSFVVLSIALNSLFLVLNSFSPAQFVTKYYEFLYDLSSDKKLVLICKKASAYELIGLNVNFYKSKNIKTLIFKDEKEILYYLERSNQKKILVLERDFFTQEKYPGYSVKTIYTILPQWISHFNYNSWINRSHIWKIQQLEKIND